MDISPTTHFCTRSVDTTISSLKNQITQHAVCSEYEEKCFYGFSSMQDYTTLDVELTDTEIQVWRSRHLQMLCIWTSRD